MGDFASLNLGGHVGDDPTAVESNRALVAGTLGVPRDHLLFMSQCHGSDIAFVDGPWQGEPPAVDALVTTATDLALAVLVADCTPVLMVDRFAGVAAAVHAGRPGMMAGIVGRAVDAMAELGARSISA
ncbi:MAG TPA: laccase domain-containing protein, partial [Dermatophilaceae bacterium]